MSCASVCLCHEVGMSFIVIVMISLEDIRSIPSSLNVSIHRINIVSFGLLLVTICSQVKYYKHSLIYENNGH